MDKLEFRYVVFMEDGQDLEGFKLIYDDYVEKLEGNTRKSVEMKPIPWQKKKHHMIIDINQYIAKYDFEIAEKLHKGNYMKLHKDRDEI